MEENAGIVGQQEYSEMWSIGFGILSQMIYLHKYKSEIHLVFGFSCLKHFTFFFWNQLWRRMLKRVIEQNFVIAYFKPIPEVFILKKEIHVKMALKKPSKTYPTTLCSSVYLIIMISELFGGSPLDNCNFW